MATLIERNISFDTYAARRGCVGYAISAASPADSTVSTQARGWLEQVCIRAVGALAMRRPGKLGPATEMELRVDVVEMHLHRAFGQVKPVRDGFIAQPTRDEVGDFCPAPGEPEGGCGPDIRRFWTISLSIHFPATRHDVHAFNQEWWPILSSNSPSAPSPCMSLMSSAPLRCRIKMMPRTPWAASSWRKGWPSAGSRYQGRTMTTSGRWRSHVGGSSTTFSHSDTDFAGWPSATPTSGRRDTQPVSPRQPASTCEPCHPDRTKLPHQINGKSNLSVAVHRLKSLKGRKGAETQRRERGLSRAQAGHIRRSGAAAYAMRSNRQVRVGRALPGNSV